MPEKAWVRDTYQITPAFRTRKPPSEPFKLEVAGAPGRSRVDVWIAATGDRVVAQALREFPDGLLERIMQDRTFNDERYGTALRDCASDVGGAVYTTLDLVAQELDHFDGYRLCNHEGAWSRDGVQWTAFPPGKLRVVDWSRSLPHLNGATVGHVQDLLDLGEDALTASEHLREAFNASDERFGWIEATIAAELAIKQVLVRMEPKLGIVLFDLPSPPLTTLYGPVLERVTGERSPFLKELGKLVEKRNKLIHRPRTESPDAEAFRDAVHMVRDAIQHLLKLDRARARATAGGVR